MTDRQRIEIAREGAQSVRNRLEKLKAWDVERDPEIMTRPEAVAFLEGAAYAYKDALVKMEVPT